MNTTTIPSSADIASPVDATEEPPALPLLGLGQMPEWMERGLCAQTDPESFFPEKGGSTREAKSICATCPVAAECLDYALDNDERFGIWGGLSERERRKVKQALREDAGLEPATSGHNATKTHCVHGHAFTPNNTPESARRAADSA
jgi:WhiB family redox-sensing transcriptional regulator